MHLERTPFCAKISQIDKYQHYDSETFFKGLFDLFSEVSKLSQPIKFEKASSYSADGYHKNKPLLMLFGEMGNGKSTTGNFIIKEQL